LSRIVSACLEVYAGIVVRFLRGKTVQPGARSIEHFDQLALAVKTS
jgi:hypothetical protein